MKKRISLDNYFMQIADIVKLRSTCIRREVGAVIVKDNHIIATGYNGAPSHCKHCTKETCLRLLKNIPSGENHELCRGSHAEQNAIAQAAKYGISIKGATIYCSLQPCIICSKIIINSGIKKVIFKNEYKENLGLELLKEAGIEIKQLKLNL